MSKYTYKYFVLKDEFTELGREKITKACLIDISVTKVRTQYNLFYFQKLVL